jgi:hypothetical protein
VKGRGRVLTPPDQGGPAVIHLPLPRRAFAASRAFPLALIVLLACVLAPGPGADGTPKAVPPASTTVVPALSGPVAEPKDGSTVVGGWRWAPLAYAGRTGQDASSPDVSLLSVALGESSGLSVPATLWAAYVKAVQGSPASCHIDVRLLAAIGEVESGSLRGRGIDAKHRAVPGVFGPVLSGGPYASIPDTDHGRWDGDPTWDRAVGPMQFIPSTWATHGVDGDGDGVADPQNVDDAALSAALYLCYGGRDLSTPQGLRAGILSYNHSASYLATVLALMNRVSPGGPAVPLVAGSGPLVVPAALPGSTSTVGPTASPTSSASSPTTSATTPSSTTTSHAVVSASMTPSPVQPRPHPTTTTPPVTTTTAPPSTTTAPPASPTSQACTSSPSDTSSTSTSGTTSPTASPTASAEPSTTSATAAEESLTSTADPSGSASPSSSTTSSPGASSDPTATPTCP